MHPARAQPPGNCYAGFLFVWVEKHTLDEVMDVFAKLHYVYVENLTWVILNPNNTARNRATYILDWRTRVFTQARAVCTGRWRN